MPPHEAKNDDLLIDPASIKRALGEEVLACLDQLTDIRRERSDTRQIRNILLKRYPQWCAACQTEFNGANRSECAHLMSLEEGGITEENNLVMLCRDCHKLFDAGRCSVNEMKGAAAAWRQGQFINLAPSMVERDKTAKSTRPRYRPDMIDSEVKVYDESQKGHNLKVLNRRKAAASSPSRTDPQKELLTIQMAGDERRRAAKGCVENALKILDDLDEQRLSPENASLYWYERGYIYQILGGHAESIRCFKKNEEVASRLKDEYSDYEVTFARHRQNALAVISLPFEPLPESQLNRLSGQFDELIERCGAYEAPFGGRLTHNIFGWKWRLLLKCGPLERLESFNQDYDALRHNQDVTNGYTRDSGIRLTSFKGLKLVKMDRQCEMETGLTLSLFARSIRSTLNNRTTPELIRDSLLGLVTVLEKKPELLPAGVAPSCITRMDDIRNRIREGSSCLDPYRAPN